MQQRTPVCSAPQREDQDTTLCLPPERDPAHFTVAELRATGCSTGKEGGKRCPDSPQGEGRSPFRKTNQPLSCFHCWSLWQAEGSKWLLHPEGWICPYGNMVAHNPSIPVTAPSTLPSAESGGDGKLPAFLRDICLW